ncbi:MAG: acetyl/propionyl/methylcrotonyl-CoA carboxylase subunit alpha [Porticoccaceae bacterium]|jgi:propionyl-CoA carboxylase alpha chain|nr:acetyl/propionyl/methylcrotonyl-CoA carboxylase subunit alpha [Porticoccaceae bacterium]
MLKKILVANRGEIACRVFATAKKMGIATVAVYSDADADALHVQMADEAVNIGPAASAESYLVIDKIIQACKDSGADAVHPGYGFLSENSKFRDALDDAGIVFIGPGKKAIESMGDKITSKLIAEKAGVNCIPGYTDVVRDADHAVAISAEVGYPVMLKASAGGGGKGMRVAWDEDDCRDGFERATNEARSSFGDTRIFIEKYIQQPRHIEIQVMADGHGNVIYLGERECSIQRRHQKVIEEAPSPFLDKATRQKMGEQSCALAKAVYYQSAGTVEFIADADMNFYFLEMNTRLQVEHPVTELVTGQDLVEMMIRVAAGEKLSLAQTDVTLTGWAMESRVYAEDPFRNFMPSIGRLSGYREPQGDGVRVDSGVYEGGDVSMNYDPMISKLITYGDNREQAIDRMVDALDAYYIRGVNHNISFLNALMVHPRFVAGELTTNFIAEEFPDGFNADLVPQNNPAIAIVVAAAVHQEYRERSAQISGQTERHEYKIATDWVVIAGGDETPVSITLTMSGFLVSIDNADYAVETDWALGEPLFEAYINDQSVCVQVERHGSGYKLFYRGAEINAQVLSPRAAELNRLMLEKVPPDTSKLLLSPMPGLLVKLAMQVGDQVKAGEELAVVEAMKMENSLRAVQDGIVAEISAETGDSLMVDQVIMAFE